MADIQLPDALLVKKYVDGDENALTVLINRHQSKIFGFIYSKISDRDISNDIFQDTFIKVIRTLKSKSYNEEGKFLPWVMRIAHNLIIDHFRRNKKMPMFRETEEFSIFSIMSDNSLTIENSRSSRNRLAKTNRGTSSRSKRSFDYANVSRYEF